MKFSFKRITSSGNFIPEIDGLRFIAITSVILLHIRNFISEKDLNNYTDGLDYSILNHFLLHGHMGVPLFFVISGFILGIPFAKWHIAKENPVNLKNFFLRRLTRLEPPYILIMTILLFAAVFVAKVISLNDGLLSYFASIIYSHELIFGVFPKLNTAAWSLEVEVQFYILAPIIAYLFTIKKTKIRRLVLISIAIFFLIINQYHIVDFHFISIIDFFQFFILGFLLSDLYISHSNILPKTRFDYLISLFFFLIIWLFDNNDFKTDSQRFIWQLVQLTSIFFFYYYVLFNKVFKFLSLSLITNIGGMCYSIYLLHVAIISIFGNPLVRISFSKYSFINISIYSILLIFAIMVISSMFFLLIERPCMDKDLYKKIFRRRTKHVEFFTKRKK